MTAKVSAPLAQANFTWLASGRSLAELSNAVAPVVLAFVMLDLTGSMVDLAVEVGARS